MPIVYRNNGDWGAGKGSNLTSQEVDENFWDHEERIVELETNPPTPIEISNIELVGTQLTIYMEDGSEYGPYTVPQASFRPTIVSEVTTTTYDPTLSDGNCYKRCTNVSGCAVTIPSNAEVPFPIDTELGFRQVGGAVTFDASSAIDAPELITISGLEIDTATVDIIGEFLSALLTFDWTIVIEFELTNDSSFTTPISISDASVDQYIEIVRYTPGSGRNMYVAEEGDTDFRYNEDGDSHTLGIHKIAVTRTDAKLVLSVNGDPIISDTGSMDITTIDRAAFGGFSGFASTQECIIHFLTIYPAQSDGSLPALSTQ